MKISDIIKSINCYYGTPEFSGMVTISPAWLDGYIGPTTAETICRLVSVVTETNYYNVGDRRDDYGHCHGGFVHASEIAYRWDGSRWIAHASRRSDIDGLVCSGWKREGDAFVRDMLFGRMPNGLSLSCFWSSVQVPDVDLSNADTAKIMAAIELDKRERAERVVWRPRPNQFVLRVHGARVEFLLPDGSTREICSLRAADTAMAALREIVGANNDALYAAIAHDPVVGRSHYEDGTYDKYSGRFSAKRYERVVGWRTYRRVMRAA